MVLASSPTPDVPSSPDTDTLHTNATPSELSTPLTQSGRTSPNSVEIEVPDESATTTQKKKKKKKSKKSKAKDASVAHSPDDADTENRPPVLCISRNKHWRYISSYHGPWLQLPAELLDSLLTLNLDPGTLSGPDTRLPPLLPPSSSVSSSKQRDRGFHGFGDFSPPDSPRNPFTSMPLPPPFPPPKPGKATPPPIDPGVFRSVRNIRRLIDEAAELSVRASSGLSAAELGSMRSGSGPGGSPWAAAQSLGINPLGNNNSGGRNVAMSATRVHRLRALAVQKLAQAYKADEIASSVMVMQGGSVFDDLAERVLRVDPNDPDARYVHFFHEKIPSRQLAESTTTNVLDDLIAMYPQRLEYYRTRGIVHCFRDEFPQATKDFTHALKEARAVRKAKMAHHNNGSQNDSRTTKHGKRRKGSSAAHTNGQAPPDGTSAMENGVEGSDGEPFLKHPSVLEDAPDPIEPQLLFLRGAAYLQHAMHLIETAVLNLEGVSKTPSIDGAELRLCYIEHGKYGGIEIGNPDGPLGKRDGPKLAAYSSTLGEKAFRDQVTQLLKRSLRDHEKFRAHFDSLESPNAIPDGDLAYQTEYAFLLSECMRPGNHSAQPPPIPDAPAMFTTYHPLLVESHFSVLICELMLADFVNILPTFIHVASVVDGLEGYPIFLPPRSMAQAEFIEVLERLASGWKNGVQPHSLSAQRGKSRLAIDLPPLVRPTPPPPTPTYKIVRSSSYQGSDNSHRVNGSSSSSSTLNYSMSNGSLYSASSSSQHTLSPTGEEKTNESNSYTYKYDHDHLLTSGPAPSPASTTSHTRSDAIEALDCARILLAPVVKRQRERAERAAALERSTLGRKKVMPINIPLHGPRVEIVLAWLAAVHLPELDDAC
ncbi:hypothetical protein JR316_0000295 [Psilocybe cubensis]|uniref:Uncharacterized protein n=2 Tax=Psilocybe cubensis TaxID=181762 RepID=A0ACB8HE71_PSICU|nr:hypothetical protein JR316_0000295 [Psilocybe cubensis]KAH9486231.1 hypothetical protein JR316_0000295 [Psilocybe cubensis]